MRLVRRLRYFWNRRKLEAELAEEMEFHQAMLHSRPAMGNTTLAREDARAIWIWPWLESVYQDLVYAVRSLRRQPGFTLVAILALTFAIGLNTSLFTVFNAITRRPWAVPNTARVVRVLAAVKNPPKGFDNVHGFSAVEYRYLAEHSRSMSGLFLTMGEGGLHLDQSKVRMVFASANYFKVLGSGMSRGRGFLPSEDRVGGPEAVAVLSYATWQNRLGSDPAVIGRRVRIEDVPFTIVGVASPDFIGTSPERTDLWLPLATVPLVSPDSWARDFLTNPDTCCADVAGRPAPGVTREQARAELSLLAAAFRRQFHETSDGVILTSTAPLANSPRLARQIYPIFGLMFAGVMLVLLLACANVGNLLLARAAARRREIGVRLSLGAGRARLVRQLLTENLALTCLAGALGVALACILPGPLFTNAVGEVSFALKPDVTVLAYTLGLAALTCLAFGLAPALHATRGNFSDAIKQQVTRAGLPLRSFLLAAQVSVSVVLLVGAGLLIRGIQHVRAQDPGFAVQGISSIDIELPASAYQGARLTAFYRSLTQGLEALPGAKPFGFSDPELLSNSRSFTGFRLPHEPETASQEIMTSTVSSGYFEVLRIPILAGRNFSPADTGRQVVLINQAMANRYFPGENPIGKTIDTGEPQEIIGVVRNAFTSGLDSVEPFLYRPVFYQASPHLLVRNTPANMEAVTALIKSLDARAQIEVHALSANMDRWLSSARMGALIASMLGLLALSLASIGISGVFAYAVQQRTREIGIRMALGARPAQVAGVVVGSAARSLGAGLAVGLAGALAGSRLIRPYLFGLNQLDALTYAVVLATLAAAALAATYLPARRAMRLDPVKALHYD